MSKKKKKKSLNHVCWQEGIKFEASWIFNKWAYSSTTTHNFAGLEPTQLSIVLQLEKYCPCTPYCIFCSNGFLKPVTSLSGIRNLDKRRGRTHVLTTWGGRPRLNQEIPQIRNGPVAHAPHISKLLPHPHF